MIRVGLRCQVDGMRKSLSTFRELMLFFDGRGFDVYLNAKGLPSGSPYFLSWDRLIVP